MATSAPATGRLGAGGAHRRPGRRHRALRRLVPRRLARPRLRRADRRGRGARRRRDRAALARRAGPGPGHRPGRLGAGQHRVVPAAAAAAHRQARRAARRRAAGTSVARKAAGAEVGALLGWMSTRVLGQYDLLVVEDEDPDDQDLVYYVGPNVLALEKRFAFPPREFRLWLALHEVTHRAQFTGVPWMRAHFLVARRRGPRRRRPRPDAAAPRRRAGIADGAAQRPQPPRRRRPGRPARHARAGRGRSQQVGGLMSLLEGHGDVTMDRAGADRIPSRRAVQPGAAGPASAGEPRHPPAPAAPRPRGEDEPVRAGRDGSSPPSRGRAGPSCSTPRSRRRRCLPTLAEIRAPERWVARMRAAPAAATA